MPHPTLETRDLTIRFGGHVAVDHVSLEVAPGTLKSIIGPNGAGKTTLFNLLSGQHRPSAGRVYFKGEDVLKLSDRRFRRMRGRELTMVSQDPSSSLNPASAVL